MNKRELDSALEHVINEDWVTSQSSQQERHELKEALRTAVEIEITAAQAKKN